MIKPLIHSILLFLFLSACTKNAAQTGGADSGTPTVVDEMTECTTSTTYTSSVTITGTAQFYKRSVTVGTSYVLGPQITSALPIRFAEIRVLDSNGNVVQCGKTNSAGALKALDGTSNLVISNSAGTYTIQVLARSNQNMTVSNGKSVFKSYVSVKDNIYDNGVYKITGTINSTGSGSYATTLTATALESISSKIEGGAFNIYNNLITVYDYLANLPDSGVNFTCLSNKLDIYWTAGFNPYLYIEPNGDPNNTVSFYLKGANELYINGGVSGDVATTDTDHFDDAVIIHEIGHYIEDACGKMDSPGGMHTGQYRIDPRLAWSEGWGNYLAAHIFRNKISSINPELSGNLPSHGWIFYFDSAGYTDPANPSAVGDEYIKINLALTGNSIANTHDRVNPTTYPGESHFREVSIARGLFKGSNTCTGAYSANCSNTDFFPDYWKSLESRAGGVGMGKSLYPFRSSVRFIERLRTVQGGSLNAFLNTLYTTDEALQPDGNANYTSGGYTVWVPYGIKLVTSGSACNLKIQPSNNSSLDGGVSDQRYSNHFYYVDKTTLSGVTSINLTAAGAVSLNLYAEGYTYGTGVLAAGTSVSLSSLSSGTNYLLDVKATGSTEQIYTLTTQSGGFLCPSSTF